MEELSQQELEQTAKVYQIRSVQKDIHNLDTKFDSSISMLTAKLDQISTQTSGVVTFEQMERYVEKKVKDETALLWSFRANATKLGWAIALLLLGDIATRILK